MLSAIKKLTEEWKSKLPFVKEKVSQLYGTEEEQHVNPFLDRNGKLINPYIDYQKLLNNSNISAKVKEFIANATGLSSGATTSTAAGTAARTTSTAGATQVSTTAKTKNGGTSSAGNITANNNIVGAAKKYIGTPYVWGGESMSEGGMDCSGFVYNALKDAGYDVGRTTAQGYREKGTKVSTSDMQPGDLIFYGDGKATHIGIYIGNGQMIHSSGDDNNTKSNPGKGVEVKNIDYRKDFLEVRRY